MHIITVLEQLGLSHHEAKLYLAALRLGESSLKDLAENTGIPRTTVQNVARSLQRSGLLSNYTVRRRPYWTAEHPKRLVTRLQEKEETLQQCLPRLLKIRHKTKHIQEVKLLRGAAELKMLLKDILDSKYHISAMLNWKFFAELLGEQTIQNFFDHCREHFLRWRILTPRSPAVALLKNSAEQTNIVRFLPENYSLNAAIFIYGHKAGITNLNKAQPLCVLVTDAEIAESFSILFENIWNQSSSN